MYQYQISTTSNINDYLYIAIKTRQVSGHIQEHVIVDWHYVTRETNFPPGLWSGRGRPGKCICGMCCLDWRIVIIF